MGEKPAGFPLGSPVSGDPSSTGVRADQSVWTYPLKPFTHKSIALPLKMTCVEIPQECGRGVKGLEKKLPTIQIMKAKPSFPLGTAPLTINVNNRIMDS